jgi:predicted RNase H-like HicB family nuclease
MKDHHINVFWSDEDDCYVADIPDFEYCSAFGDTPQEALAEVLIAKEGWLETARECGKPIPEPRYRPVPFRPAKTRAAC